jgi:hypothetical protein
MPTSAAPPTSSLPSKSKFTYSAHLFCELSTLMLCSVRSLDTCLRVGHVVGLAL